MSLLPISKPVAETPLASPVSDCRPAEAVTGAPHPDAVLIAAYAEFIGLQREMVHGERLPDQEFMALSHRSDAVCGDALAVEPETVLGMAIQVHMAFHLAFGGTYADAMAVSYPEKDEEFDYLRPIYDRAFRLTARRRLVEGAA